MAGVEESGNEDSGDHGSDSVTSFWNIKTCTFQEQYQPYFGNEWYDKRFTTDWGFGCVLMPNGQAVLCNGMKCCVQIIELTSPQVVEISCAHEQPYGITLLDKDRVIVSVPSAKVLQPISITPGVQLGKQILLKIAGYDVECRDNKFYVSTDNLNEWAGFICGGIQVLAQNGDVLQNIQLFERPRNFCVDNNGVVLVNAMKRKNNYEIIRHVSVLRQPNCVIMDDDGNVMMSSSNEVLVVKSGGTETKTLINEQNPYSTGQPAKPFRIAFSYSPSDDSLLCFAAFLSSEINNPPDYRCSIQFMCKKYKLEV